MNAGQEGAPGPFRRVKRGDSDDSDSNSVVIWRVT